MLGMIISYLSTKTYVVGNQEHTKQMFKQMIRIYSQFYAQNICLSGL